MEPVNQKSDISSQAAYCIGWAGTAAVIAGLALAVLSGTAAQALHTHSAYFYGPGLGLAGAGVLALIWMSCCYEEPKTEDPFTANWDEIQARRQLDAKKEAAPADDPNPSEEGSVVGETEFDGQPGPADAAHPSEEDDGVGKAEFDKEAGAGPADAAHPSEEGDGAGEAKEIVFESLFPKIESVGDYKVGSYFIGIPDQKVTKPFDVASVYEKGVRPWATRKLANPVEKAQRDALLPDPRARAAEERKALKKQSAYLDRDYVYQVTEASGDCFYISLISGILHKMLAEGTKEDLKEQLEFLPIDGQAAAAHEKSSHQDIFKLIDEVTDLDSLVALLTNDDKMVPFIMFMRKIAYTRCEHELPIERKKMLIRREYTAGPEIFEMAKLFGGQMAITAECKDYDQAGHDDMGIFRHDDHAAPFIILFRRGNHFDVLHKKETLAALGIPQA